MKRLFAMFLVIAGMLALTVPAAASVREFLPYTPANREEVKYTIKDGVVVDLNGKPYEYQITATPGDVLAENETYRNIVTTRLNQFIKFGFDTSRLDTNIHDITLDVNSSYWEHFTDGNGKHMSIGLQYSIYCDYDVVFKIFLNIFPNIQADGSFEWVGLYDSTRIELWYQSYGYHPSFIMEDGRHIVDQQADLLNPDVQYCYDVILGKVLTLRQYREQLNTSYSMENIAPSYDTNKDGVLNQQEFDKWCADGFPTTVPKLSKEQLDVNGDGRVNGIDYLIGLAKLDIAIWEIVMGEVNP